jgi:hypothetical protein
VGLSSHLCSVLLRQGGTAVARQLLGGGC